MTVLDTPIPSRRAKSSSAIDLRFGRRGGRQLPLQSDFEQAAAFAQAIEGGQVVHTTCGCASWWLARRDVGQRCHSCDLPMLARRDWILLDDGAAVSIYVDGPALEHELHRDTAGWIILDHAIGPCVVCNEPCRSWDADNDPRHLMCERERS